MLTTAVVPPLYTRRMRPLSKFVLVFASISFLAITLSGFHLHADASTHDEKAPHEHVHHYGAPPELDEDHIDISVFEPATGFCKCEAVAVVSTLLEFTPVSRSTSPLSANRHDSRPQRQFRWRPELRGPPFSI